MKLIQDGLLLAMVLLQITTPDIDDFIIPAHVRKLSLFCLSLVLVGIKIYKSIKKKE